MQISIFIEYSSAPSAASNRQTLIPCIFWFLPNRQPFLHKITFLDTCQKMVSTHAPQFWNNLFYSEITPTSIQSHSSYSVHTAYPVQLGKIFFALNLSSSRPHNGNLPIHLPSFYPRAPRLDPRVKAMLGHATDSPFLPWAINHPIGTVVSSSARAFFAFFFLKPQKP